MIWIAYCVIWFDVGCFYVFWYFCEHMIVSTCFVPCQHVGISILKKLKGALTNKHWYFSWAAIPSNFFIDLFMSIIRMISLPLLWWFFMWRIRSFITLVLGRWFVLCRFALIDHCWYAAILSLFVEIWVLQTIYAEIIVVLCIGWPMVIMHHLPSGLSFSFIYCVILADVMITVLPVFYSILLMHLMLISVLIIVYDFFYCY